MLKKISFVFVFFVIAAIQLYWLPKLFIPKRWLEIVPGISRCSVHAVLGVPDAGYLAKGFEGWDNSFWYGASVLIVHYAEGDDSLVREVEISSDFGFEYVSWERGYRGYLNKGAILKKMDSCLN